MPKMAFDLDYEVSPNAIANLLPISFIIATCSGVHVSSATDLTLLMWTPRLRWMPAQRMQTNMPMLCDAHRGPINQISKDQSRLSRWHWQYQQDAKTNSPRKDNLIIRHIATSTIEFTFWITVGTVWVVLGSQYIVQNLFQFLLNEFITSVLVTRHCHVNID